jgi:YVTN family beta-propeller protein
MRGGLRKWTVCACIALVLGAAGVAIARSRHSGVIGPSLGITANGRVLHPIGRMTTVGDFPTGSALTPDGRFLWVVDCGHGPNDVRVMNVASGEVVQVLPLPGCYGGIAISKDSKGVVRAYVSGTPAPIPPEKRVTPAEKGDVIHIFTVDVTAGTGIEQTPLQLPEVKGGSGRTNSLPPTKEGVGTAYPEGLAISPDGKTLVVALSDADSADVINLATSEQNVVTVGHYPNDVAFDRQGRAYVSNEYDGTLSVINTATASVTNTITGLGGALGDLASHPEGMALDPVREQLYVAVTNRDLVAVVDTSAQSVSRLISVARPQALGTEPVKLTVTPDGKTLFAADANEDAVATIALAGKGRHHRGAYRLIGRISTAAYPDDVKVTPDGSQLIWIAGKGYGSGPIGATEGSYVLDMLLGRVGVLPLPSYGQLKRLTRIANKELLPFNREAQPSGSPVPAPGQGPSQQIKHVFYIVRENRTYDQVFGSDPRGEGEKRDELFGDNGEAGPSGGITPNAHALTRTAGPLLDHFYMDAEVSVDGHLIAVGGIATDYVQKETAANYSGRRETYDFGVYPVTFPPRFFIFDQAAAQGVTFKDFGEAAAGLFPSSGNATNRPEYSNVLANFDTAYPNDLFIGCQKPGVLASCTQDSGLYKGTGKTIAGQSRVNEWLPHFEEEVAKGSVPALTMMLLMNNHTNGTTPKDYTPQAMNADNDLALGQMVDAISHSPIWSSSAIFVEEDDSQDGFDHIDSHRSPALVISPWARHGAVVHQRYDQYSMLRTIELISGIDPLSLNDALATPMYGAFIGGGEKPDNAPYNVIAPTQDIGAINPEHTALAHLSARLPWNRIDLIPEEIQDKVLWWSEHGMRSTPPPPGPNASPYERARAATAWRMLARGENAAAWLSSSRRANEPGG